MQFQYCNLPKLEKDDDIQLIAFYSDGRILQKKGSTRNTYISPEKKKLYLKYLEMLDVARTKINNDEITTKTQLNAWLKANGPKDVTNSLSDNSMNVVYTFAGPVTKLSFSVRDTVKQTKKFTSTYKIRYNEEEKYYFTSLDFATQKIGLLNKAGKWVIKPQFDDNFRIQNRYFYWDQINDKVNTFWLDHKTETIQKVPYLIDDTEIFNGRYVKIQKQVNGPRGIVDALTGKIILPMEYDQLTFESNKFWVGEKNKRAGIYDRNFKLLLPFEFENIAVDGAYFFTMENGDRTNAYDENGQNLTKNKFNQIKGTYNNGLLLVRNFEEKKKGLRSNTQYFYVDKLNNMKINVSAKGYDDPEPFNGGMAIVKNGDYKSGYINTAGTLVIPCRFRNAWNFYPTSQLALVQLENEKYVLIDRNGKVKKQFNAEMSKQETNSGNRASRIYLRDQSVFNEYGEEVKDEKKQR